MSHQLEALRTIQHSLDKIKTMVSTFRYNLPAANVQYLHSLAVNAEEALAQLSAQSDHSEDKLEMVAQSEAAGVPAAWLHRQGDYAEPSSRRLDPEERARGWTEEPLYLAAPSPQPVKQEDWISRELVAKWLACTAPEVHAAFLREFPEPLTQPPQPSKEGS